LNHFTAMNLVAVVDILFANNRIVRTLLKKRNVSNLRLLVERDNIIHLLVESCHSQEYKADRLDTLGLALEDLLGHRVKMHNPQEGTKIKRLVAIPLNNIRDTIQDLVTWDLLGTKVCKMDEKMHSQSMYQEYPWIKRLLASKQIPPSKYPMLSIISSLFYLDRSNALLKMVESQSDVESHDFLCCYAACFLHRRYDLFQKVADAGKMDLLDNFTQHDWEQVVHLCPEYKRRDLIVLICDCLPFASITKAVVRHVYVDQQKRSVTDIEQTYEQGQMPSLKKTMYFLVIECVRKKDHVLLLRNKFIQDI
jgi:hypothetical protein